MTAPTLALEAARALVRDPTPTSDPISNPPPPWLYPCQADVPCGGVVASCPSEATHYGTDGTPLCDACNPRRGA